MKPQCNPRYLALTILLGSLGLSGCGGSMNFPDAVSTQQAQQPAVHGSVYGGHAPIVGSHVYMLQPGTTGYGSAATSLLTTASGGTANTSDPNIPVGAVYVPTDSTGAFYIASYSCTVGQPVYLYSYGGTSTGVTTGTVNPIVQLATLGICPPPPDPTNPIDNFYGVIKYIYINEVSTVAAAYTFQPFTLASNNSAWDIGTSGTTQALLGIKNAALTAAQLYSIQGNAQLSSTSDGEGHIANYQTQLNGLPNSGNGVIPQATIDTLANILAACIDSTPASTGALSAQCTSLFNTATDNGQTVSSGDTPATDTASAAINIARYPGGNNSGATSTINTSYVSTLYGIPTGTVPYAPYLNAQPQDDWTIAINYPQTAITGYPGATNNLVGNAEGIAVDGNGAVWFTARTNDDLVRWSSLGEQQAALSPGYTLGYNVSVDPQNNAWTGAGSGPAGILEASSDGVNSATYGSGYSAAHTVITDHSNDAFFFATTSTNTNSEMFEYPSGATASTTPSSFTVSPGAISAGNTVDHGAIDPSGDLWITSESSDQVARVTVTGATLFTASVGAQPEVPAIDGSGNAWIAGQGSSSSPYTAFIYVVSPTGTVTTLDSSTTAAALSATFGSAVDGNGNVWFDSRCGYNGACSTALGVSTVFVINGKTMTAISPPNNYIPEAQYGANASNTTLTPILHDAINMAIDPSGNIWMTNFLGNEIVEVVGAAAPVVTPLSVAAGKGLLGTKP